MESVLLPKNVIPRKYSITLEPDLTTLEFVGSEDIEVEGAHLFFPPSLEYT